MADPRLFGLLIAAAPGLDLLKHPAHGLRPSPGGCCFRLADQAAGRRLCQPPQVLHGGCELELLGRPLQPA